MAKTIKDECVCSSRLFPAQFRCLSYLVSIHSQKRRLTGRRHQLSLQDVASMAKTTRAGAAKRSVTVSAKCTPIGFPCLACACALYL